MLPYDGIIRTGSKGVSHSALYFEIWAETPSEGRKLLESLAKGKRVIFRHGCLLAMLCGME
jgi:hypothetical protein